jgi:hypothetical protein
MLGRLALVIHWLFFSVGAAFLLSGAVFFGSEINSQRYSNPPSDDFLLEELSSSDFEIYKAGDGYIEGMSVDGEIIVLSNMILSWRVNWRGVFQQYGDYFTFSVIGIFSLLLGFTIRFVLTGNKYLFPWRHK